MCIRDRFNKEHGVTVVMISSELEELRTTCDRIAIVSGGKIAGILPATESDVYKRQVLRLTLRTTAL